MSLSTTLFTLFYGELVGTDEFGNKYYRNTKKRFGFLQSIMGNDIPMDKTSYFTEMNHPGIILENKEKSEVLRIRIS